MKKPFLLLVAVAALGCSTNNMSDDGLSSSDKQTANRLTEIAKASGGDWNKVPQADKDYILTQVANGSEQTAKMMLQAKAGTLNGGAGGAGK